MKNKKLFVLGVYFLIFGSFALFKSIKAPISDFGNSYYPALASQSYHDEALFFLYDLDKYNRYVNQIEKMDNVVLDFYLNTPFTCTFFYPFTLIENALKAKLLFNCFSYLIFVFAVLLFFKTYLPDSNLLLILLIPLIFLTPLVNHINTGQSYFVCFAFLLIGYHLINGKWWLLGCLLLALAVLIKIFPLLLLTPLIISKRYKQTLFTLSFVLVLVFISVVHLGFNFWHVYLTDVLLASVKYQTAVDWHFSGQSMEVFLKNLFFKDNNYNPLGLFNDPLVYAVLLFAFKTLVASIIVAFVYQNRENELAILASLTIGYFVLQNRTASYAQVFWVIPMVFLLSLQISKAQKLFFLCLLTLMVNWPYWRFEKANEFFAYGRMWACLGLFIFVFFFAFRMMFRLRPAYLLVGIAFLPQLVNAKKHSPNYTYVWPNHKNFVTYNYIVKRGELTVFALGINGVNSASRKFPITEIDTNACEVIDNQIFLHHKPTGIRSSLIKKPILINKNEIWYLSDRNGRFGWLTLQKVSTQKL
ncbi:glycosyltransferase 87 family protein [Nubsella zeaxanthinifaciens]|uniref:glycosyltransferase 87 family protein n=1 Tax=Nubsella zeaxanthinifaciens TaxID=392412 RepID=UPI003CFF5FA3